MDGWITSEGSVLIRSGQQRLEGPQKRVQIYLKRVGATFDPKLGQHTVPCANLRKIPALELHFGGKKAVLKVSLGWGFEAFLLLDFVNVF